MSQPNDFQDSGVGPQESQANPFSADLKGDFASNFGTSTNAVSQIFKEGGFVGENKSRLLIIIGALVLAAGLGYYFLGGDSYEGDELAGEDAAALDEGMGEGDDMDHSLTPPETTSDAAQPAGKEAAPPAAASHASRAKGALRSNEPAASESDHTSTATIATEWPPASEAPTAKSPADGAVHAYDETAGHAEFSWSGSPGGWIVFAREASMRPVAFRARVSGHSYTFRRPHPGQWYWQVQNGAGASAVRSFRIEAPVRRALALSAPSDGGSIAGNGGAVIWSGASKVSYYRVELSNNGAWASPLFRFASSGTQLNLESVPPGQYQMRLGGFSEIAGRWEYNPPISVTVQ